MAPRIQIRIETLSDLVFGLALSIGSIALINQSYDNLNDVLRGLFWVSFSFFILIGVWMTYSRVVSAVRIETEGMMRLNIALLLLVIIEPFLLNVLAFDISAKADRIFLDGTTILYALDLAGIWLIMGGFFHIAMKQSEGSGHLRKERNLRLLDAAVFLISILPLFWAWTLMEVPLRYLIWFLSLPIGMVADRWFFKERRTGTGERGE
jgi:uncharacterized membrane protein